MLETIISGIAIILFTTTILVLVYCSFLKSQLSFLSHESLVCLESYGDKEKCIKRLTKTINSILVFGEIKKIKSWKFNSVRKISIQLSFASSNKYSVKTWEFNDQIQIPLRGTN